MSSDGSTAHDAPLVDHSRESTLLLRRIPGSLSLTAAEIRGLRTFVRRLARELAAGSRFTCLLTNDRELRSLNGHFRGHDCATDVLSFPAATAPSEGYLGDIAISVERAGAQASEFGHSLVDELRVLMLHGVLHLTGFDHERDRGEMARAERTWRDAFGLPATLIGRRHTASRRAVSARAARAR